MNCNTLIWLCVGIVCINIHLTGCEQVNCSRHDSDIVRKFIDEKVIPAYEKLAVSIPEKCLWNKNRDIFDKQNLMIQKLSGENWQCGFCGKAFYSEPYLWQHLDRKHSAQLYKGLDSVCLADLCPIIRCDIVRSPYSKRTSTNWAQKLCNRDHMLALKSRSIAMIEQCLAPDSANYQILKDYLVSIIAEYLSCEKYWQPSTQTDDHWFSVNVYHGIVLFVVGIVVYYIALFVRLNKLDNGLSDDGSPDLYPMRRQHQGKYHGVDLTYRGKRAVS